MLSTPRVRASIVASALVALGFPLVHSAHAAVTSITSCGTVISAPGTYSLDSDLTCPTEVGVDIAASNVNLRMNRHTIDADGGPFAPIVLANDTSRSGIRVIGPGTVTGSTNAGVLVRNASDSLVMGITAIGNASGISTYSPVAGGGNLRFIANKLVDNEYGLYSSRGDAASNLVAYNECADNSEAGIAVFGYGSGGGFTVYGNTCTGNGIGILNDNPGNRYIVNTATTNDVDLAERVTDCVGSVWYNNDYDTSENDVGCVASTSPPTATAITTCGTTITSPGNYRLESDLTCPTEPGVVIEASNVTLSMNRHTIDTSGGAGDRAILVADNTAQSGIRVLGPGTVTGAINYGLEVHRASNSLVAGVTATENRIGMRLTGDTGAGNVQLIANKMVDNTQHGLSAAGGDTANHLVAFNDCSDNGFGGDGFGIAVGVFAGWGTTVYGNTCSGNGQYGILSSYPGNVIAANTAKSNAVADLSEQSGAPNPSCAGNIWYNNDFETSDLPCID